jgi:hypothetical protein
MPTKPDVSEFTARTENDELRRQVSDLQAKLRRTRGEKADLVRAVQEGSRDALAALGPLPKVAAPKADTRKKRTEAALWHLTDWQGAKTSTTYNTEVMRERVLHFCDKAALITEMQRADHPVRDAVILFGGDMIEGLFNFPTQPFEIDSSLFGQFAASARLEAEVVRRALSIYENVTVIGEFGNHGRIGSKRSAVPRSDNVDRMTYELAREILGVDDRLVWEDSNEDMQRVEIGNYRALLIHGDEVGRNGFASPMTMVNHVAKWKSGAYPWRFRDVYVGHYHNHSEWALPDGEGALYQTGSPESDNRYARDTMAAASQPSQRLHFIDPDRGRVSAQFKVWLED